MQGRLRVCAILYANHPAPSLKSQEGQGAETREPQAEANSVRQALTLLRPGHFS